MVTLMVRVNETLVIIFNFRILKHTLIAGGSYVNQNPDTLAFDLLGRLLDFYEVYDDIRQLLHDCDSESRKHSALLPLFQCYEAPSGVLLYILEDHTKVSAEPRRIWTPSQWKDWQEKLA